MHISVHFFYEYSMKKIAFLYLVFFISNEAFPQLDQSIIYAKTITSDDLKDHLSILASDALEGRETGKRGQKMAAAYIQHHFESNGLKPIIPSSSGNSFLQSFELEKIRPGKTWIKIGNVMYSNFQDFVYTGKRTFKDPLKSKPVFVGVGDNKSYDAIKVKGKGVLVYCDCNTSERDEKAELAYERGASNVFIIKPGSESDYEKIMSLQKRNISSAKLSFPTVNEELEAGYFLISESMSADILNTSQKNIKNATEKSSNGKYASLLNLKPSEITFYASQIVDKISTENVLGLIEGSDKKEEFIIVTAHYDHIGVDGEEINNGADDDGSGTVAVLEMAQAFALAKQSGHGPRRSILFLSVTAEEKGLLGSSYYVQHPPIPLNSTITNLNIDMIGRIDGNHRESSNYVYLIGSDKLSTELHAVSEEVNATYTELDLDYKYNDENDPNRFYYRSDHYNFAKNNIPIIFYFNGTHADYHRPTDTVDKIEFELLKKRTQLIFHTAWEIANRDDRITVDITPEEMKLKDSN